MRVVRRPSGNPLRRAQIAIGSVLILLTAGAWMLLVQGQRGSMHGGAVTPTMGLAAPVFLGVWLVMVAAMMFPATAPMLLMFARVAANRRTNSRAWVPTIFFTLGYLIVWSAVGATAFGFGSLSEWLARRFDVVAAVGPRVGALLIVAAGVFQFSALKDRCMTECRSPLAFLTMHWREGARGAVTMGMRHGVVCVGCCWALMAILFPLGMMNIAALGLVTTLIFAERVLPGGKALQLAAGVALLGLGAAAFVSPDMLPGGTASMGDTMQMSGAMP
ncbi:MAG: hypothetical protein ABS81_06965 [Pseudonocardia sp. SCN 72-86]|nr:MAG: hypothetical protein ABS81_06965 [Pseudonocardia sp. SCN 72-86]